MVPAIMLLLYNKSMALSGGLVSPDPYVSLGFDDGEEGTDRGGRRIERGG